MIFYKMKGCLIMLKKNKRIIPFALGCLLCAGLLFNQPAFLYAAENSSGTQGEAAAPTPTPNPHTEYYTQKASSDDIEGWPQGPQIEAESAIVMDVYTEAILYSKNADKKQYPASITKIMTTLLGCENLDLNAKMVVSEAAAYGIEPGSSSIYAEAGEEFTVTQALMAVMLESANEMSIAIGEEVSGSTKKFVELMNERARQIGCTNTHFNNPNGLPDETHYTTAADMAKIAKTAWFNPLFRKFATKDLYELKPTNKRSESLWMLNHHKMMAGREYAYDGVVGGKTGYTDAAGSTLVTFAKRGSTILLVVVLNSVNGAWSDTAALLDYGFDNFERIKIEVDKDPVPVKTLPSEKYILKDGGDIFPFYSLRNVYVSVPKGTDVSALTTKQDLLPNAAGPLRLRTRYYYHKHTVGWGVQYERNILSDLLH